MSAFHSSQHRAFDSTEVSWGLVQKMYSFIWITVLICRPDNRQENICSDASVSPALRGKQRNEESTVVIHPSFSSSSLPAAGCGGHQGALVRACDAPESRPSVDKGLCVWHASEHGQSGKIWWHESYEDSRGLHSPSQVHLRLPESPRQLQLAALRVISSPVAGRYQLAGVHRPRQAKGAKGSPLEGSRGCGS